MGAAASTGQQPQPTTRDFEILLASEDSGVEFHGVLSQGGSKLELSYRIHAPLADCPAIVSETRKSLGWDAALPELICDASCSIASFGMDREPMLASLDIHPTDRKLRVPISSAGHTQSLHSIRLHSPIHLSKPGTVRVPQVLMMSPTKPELGLVVAHLDCRARPLPTLVGGDETWWTGSEAVITTAMRRSAKSEADAKANADAAADAASLGLPPGSVFVGTRRHAMFGQVGCELALDEALVAPPGEAAALCSKAAWPPGAEGARLAAVKRVQWWSGHWRVPEMKAEDAVFVGVLPGEGPALPLAVLTPVEGRTDQVKLGQLDRATRAIVGGGMQWRADDAPEYSLSKKEPTKKGPD